MEFSGNLVTLCLCLIFVMGVDSRNQVVVAPSPESNNQVSCSAFASLSVRITDIGSCSGVASANCEAITIAQNVFRDAYDNWWAEGGFCDDGKATAAAEAIAKAVASVYTSSVAKVRCFGAGGFACGWAIGDGDAFGVSFATAVAQASADAGDLDNAEAFCASDVAAKGGAIAEAASRSQADACVKGEGSESDFEAGLVTTVTEIIAEAFAEATADACNDNISKAEAQTKCEARSEVRKSSRLIESSIGGATVAGSTDTIPDCDTPIKNSCCASEYRSRQCVCAGCNGPLIRLATFKDGGLRTWRDADNAVCKCV